MAQHAQPQSQPNGVLDGALQPNDRSNITPYRARPRRRKRQPAKIKSLQRHRTMATTQRGNIPPRRVGKAEESSSGRSAASTKQETASTKKPAERWRNSLQPHNREPAVSTPQLPQIASLCGRTRGRHEDTKSHRIDTMLTKFDQNTTDTCVG